MSLAGTISRKLLEVKAALAANTQKRQAATSMGIYRGWWHDVVPAGVNGQYNGWWHDVPPPSVNGQYKGWGHDVVPIWG